MLRKCFDRANCKMNYLTITAYIFFIFIISACGSRFLTVHKIDVQQGNALDAEMVDKINLGMNKEQVKYVLGSPLITDSFHPDRWDYIYLFIPGYGEQQRRQLTLTFDRNEVIDIAKQNIVKGDPVGTQPSDKELEENSEEKLNEGDKLSEREKKELQEAEEQAEQQKEALETNKNPDQ